MKNSEGVATRLNRSHNLAMLKPRTARWEEKREAILASGARVLNRTGLSGFRLADVASEIGLKRPSIVYYFANVEELAEALYERALSQLEERIAQAEKRETPLERLDTLLELELAHHAEERVGRAIRRPQLGEIRALSWERRRKLGQRYHQLLERVSAMLGREAQRPRLIEQLGPAHIVMETLFWLPAWIDEYEPWYFARVRAALLDTLVSGVMIPGVSPGDHRIAEGARLERETIDQNDYLQAATRLISDRGFRGAAIDRISSELGVTKGSFYHHITQKAELIEACFAHSQGRLSEIQKRASERGFRSDERIAAVVKSVIGIQLGGGFPLLRNSALPALSEDARAKIIAQSKRNFRWFSSEISAGIAEGTMQSRDPYIAAQVFGVAINAVYDLSRVYRDEITVEDDEAYAGLLMHGILTSQ
ncbi:TetR/AcrR family transcriptional regulator [Erythrobacter sp. SCSIO 43205]|uniref:TetR/AcrR family transcriptional regulator n=1 Tax=Erythrobacter sp. SCSIO 43205 TaxID=2779361 RepID=UPI001CAA39B9|nr:TetR/AcrR family transcriptional regulator [Erythrobacter sp. SCSIO 43205]UAB78867.1 TetR/AcrR family transcriptional regulator [Erythrobacter sp. SCSIO 43205]